MIKLLLIIALICIIILVLFIFAFFKFDSVREWHYEHGVLSSAIVSILTVIPTAIIMELFF